MVVRRDEAYEEQGQFIAWIFWTIVWTLVSFYLLLILNMTLLHWIREGFSIMSLNSAFAFWKNSSCIPAASLTPMPIGSSGFQTRCADDFLFTIPVFLSPFLSLSSGC